jgi:hypothetical protein
MEVILEEIFKMTEKEVYRCNIIQQVKDKRITQMKAAEILKISDRQVRNLLRILHDHGPKGLRSKKRGKRSNNFIPRALKKEAVKLIRDLYDDFGPTLAQEKLVERHGIKMSVETVRKLMIENNIIENKKDRPKKVHQTRPRRENFGELIQIDASIHDWFEGRGDKCALIVFIDDATSKITGLHFHKSECLEAYFQTLEHHLTKYGRPLSIYSDRHSIFGGADRIKHAQLRRAFKELDIEGILARSPQAKGRVERVNRTLQDRLIKEMRLRGISNIEDANAFLVEYLEIHNNRFSKEPRGQIDTHRPLDSGHNLRFILASREERTLSNSLSISFYNKTINILEPTIKNRLKRKRVNVIERHDGTIEVYFQGKLLKSAFANEIIEEKKVLDYKDKILWRPKREKPKKSHPWKKYGHQIGLANQIRKKERGVV